MRRALFFVALAVLPAEGQVGSIALYTQFEHPPNGAVVDSLKAEVSSIMAPEGLRFEWRSLPARGNEVSMELAVITFKGTCDALSPGRTLHAGTRLGWSHVSDGAVLPFTDVDCDSIRGFVLKRLADLQEPFREHVFGRAIGRVLAHELYHIFAQTTHHGSGVDRPTYTVQELLSNDFIFGEIGSSIHVLHPSLSLRAKHTEASPEAGRLVYLNNGCAGCHGARGEGTKHGPVLHVAGRFLNSVVLAAKLGKGEKNMCRRAHDLNLPAPSLAEEDLENLVSFLNHLEP
ncbi:MAG TPA: cytochrome c [Bryobacteraceae bacterium]|nr:cytochrome c [Bryobacteraceae bacterium]